MQKTTWKLSYALPNEYPGPGIRSIGDGAAYRRESTTSGTSGSSIIIIDAQNPVKTQLAGSIIPGAIR